MLCAPTWTVPPPAKTNPVAVLHTPGQPRASLRVLAVGDPNKSSNSLVFKAWAVMLGFNSKESSVRELKILLCGGNKRTEDREKRQKNVKKILLLKQALVTQQILNPNILTNKKR